MIVTRNNRVITPRSPDELKEGDIVEFSTGEILQYDGRLCGFASRGMYQITWASKEIKKSTAKITNVDNDCVSSIVNIDGVYYICGANKNQIKLELCL